MIKERVVGQRQGSTASSPDDRGLISTGLVMHSAHGSAPAAIRATGAVPAGCGQWQPGSCHNSLARRPNMT
jgi:hypothetical protein